MKFLSVNWKFFFLSEKIELNPFAIEVLKGDIRVDCKNKVYLLQLDLSF